jgi:hypothetical protein
MVKLNWKKVGALCLGALGIFGLSACEPQVVTRTEYVTEFVDVPCPELVVPEPVVEEVVVTEYVDNENLPVVLEHLHENDGQVEYLLEDLDDDELDLIVERIAFINEVRSLAIDEVKSEGLDELDKEVFEGFVFDEDDVDRFRVDRDLEDALILDVDFEDGDAEVLVSARVDQDDGEFEVDFLVEFRDGEVDDLSVEEIRYND